MDYNEKKEKHDTAILPKFGETEAEKHAAGVIDSFFKEVNKHSADLLGIDRFISLLQAD